MNLFINTVVVQSMKVNKSIQEKPISNMEGFDEFSSLELLHLFFQWINVRISIHSVQNDEMCTSLLPGGCWVLCARIVHNTISWMRCDARLEYNVAVKHYNHHLGICYMYNGFLKEIQYSIWLRILKTELRWKWVNAWNYVKIECENRFIVGTCIK